MSTPTTMKDCTAITVLVHYHTTLTEHPQVVAKLPQVLEAVGWLIEQELLISVPGSSKNRLAASWTTSEKGRVMVNKLLAVPLPVATWS